MGPRPMSALTSVCIPATHVFLEFHSPSPITVSLPLFSPERVTHLCPSHSSARVKTLKSEGGSRGQVLPRSRCHPRRSRTRRRFTGSPFWSTCAWPRSSRPARTSATGYVSTDGRAGETVCRKHWPAAWRHIQCCGRI